MAWALLWLLVGCEAPEETPVEGEVMLKVDEPAAGAWVEAGPLQVRGLASGLSEVTVDGAAAGMEGARFVGSVEVPRGVTAIEVRGADPNGDTRFDRRSVLAGEFRTAAGTVDDAVAVQITQEGLDQVVAGVAGLLDVEALVATLQAGNPVVSETLIGIRYDVDLESLTMQPPLIGTHMREGALGLTVIVEDLDVVVRVQDSIGLLDATASVHIEQVTAEVDLGLRAVGGGLDALLGPIQLDVQSFSFDTSLFPGAVEEAIPFLSDIILDFILDTLNDQIRVVAPAVVDSVEEALALTFELPFGERIFAVEGLFHDVAIHPDAAYVSMDLGVTVDSERGDLRWLGVLTSAVAPHEIPLDAPIGMSLHDDLLNRILFEAWRGGLLQLSMSSADEPLLGLLFGQLGSPEGSLSVDMKLPPVAVQGDDGLELQFGEVDLTINTPGGTYGNSVRVRLAGGMPLSPSINDGELGVTLGEPVLSMMVVETDWRASENTITNLLLDQLPIDSLLMIAQAITFPLPALAGLYVDEATAVRGGSGVHTVVSLSLGLAEEPAP